MSIFPLLSALYWFFELYDSFFHLCWGFSLVQSCSLVLSWIDYNVNFHIDSFKSYKQRLKETENTNSIIQIVIKIADFKKQNQDIYNCLTLIEVLEIFINKNDLYTGIIEQNLIIKIRKSGFQHILYWHFIYIVL